MTIENKFTDRHGSHDGFWLNEKKMEKDKKVRFRFALLLKSAGICRLLPALSGAVKRGDGWHEHWIGVSTKKRKGQRMLRTRIRYSDGLVCFRMLRARRLVCSRMLRTQRMLNS